MNLLKLSRDKPSTSYAMTGRLYLSKSGWLMLSVPNALVQGVFATLDEPGAQLPSMGPDDPLRAHISVMRPEELEEIGGAGKVNERGKTYSYTLGRLKSVTPGGWDEVSRVWLIEVKSPELEKLRKSYGLSRVPKNGEYEFHITVAIRKKKVTQENDVNKLSSALTLLPQLRDNLLGV